MAEFGRSRSIPHLEVRRSTQAGQCYRPHAHDSLSIGVIDVGTSVFSGPIEGTAGLTPGDVVVIPAGQVHACNPDKGGWCYRMIHLDQAWAAALLDKGESSHIFDGVRVLRHGDLHQRAHAVSDAIVADRPREELTARVTALLVACESASPAHLAGSVADPELLARLAPVMRRLSTDESNPTLDELAESVGMTRYQLSRSMRRAGPDGNRHLREPQMSSRA